MGILDQILAHVDNLRRVAGKNTQDFVANPKDFLSMVTGRVSEQNKKLAAGDPAEIENVISAGLPGGVLATRWQGSPNFIKGTKLDMSKLGTGEGAQVYGKGHYVAENPEVADRYRESLSIRRLLKKFTSEFDTDTGYLDQKLFTDKEMGLLSPEKKYLSALQEADFLGYDGPARGMIASSRSDARTAYDLGPNLEQSLGKLGHLYKIDVPDEAIAKMINIDKSFGEQTTEVKS